MSVTIGQFVDAVHKRPYPDCRRAIRAYCGPKRQKSFIYKYMPLNPGDKQSIDRLRDVVVRSKLWLSSPKDFNDPFDMTARFVIKWTKNELKDRYIGLLKQQGVRSKKRREYMKHVKKMAPNKLRHELDANYKKELEHVGVCSFSRDPRNIQMWSHYAKDHTGICVRLERIRDYRTFSQAIPVEYSPNYPEVNWVKNFADDLRVAVLRKHEGWAYEQEERIVLVGEAGRYKQFCPEAVVGLIQGYRMSRDSRKIVEQLIEERKQKAMPPVKLYKANKHIREYRLTILRIGN